MLSCLSCVWLFATPRAVALQAPLSMGFSRQEYRNGFPHLPPADLPDPGIEPLSPVSPALRADSLLLSHQGSPRDPVKCPPVQRTPPTPKNSPAQFVSGVKAEKLCIRGFWAGSDRARSEWERQGASREAAAMAWPWGARSASFLSSRLCFINSLFPGQLYFDCCVLGHRDL